MIAYLIEYMGAVPSPVYVPEIFIHGCYTLDAWLAKRFKTQAEAEQWMDNPICGSTYCVPFDKPWIAIAHSLPVTCALCRKDLGFLVTGETGYCDSCIPF
jgi:hypothetical protein